MKIGNKGKTSTSTMIVGGLLLVLFAGAVGWLASTSLSARQPVVGAVFDGEFTDVDVPEEIDGTDISVNASYDEDTPSDDEFTALFDTVSRVNGTDGVTTYVAFTFKTDGDMEKLEIQGDLNSTTTVSEMQIQRAYLIPDEEGYTIDISDAKDYGYLGEVADDNDEFTFDIDAFPEGDWTLVAELKGIATSTISNEDGLLIVDFDADTDGDLDTGKVYIKNYEVQPTL